MYKLNLILASCLVLASNAFAASEANFTLTWDGEVPGVVDSGSGFAIRGKDGYNPIINESLIVSSDDYSLSSPSLEFEVRKEGSETDYYESPVKFTLNGLAMTVDDSSVSISGIYSSLTLGATVRNSGSEKTLRVGDSVDTDASDGSVAHENNAISFRVMSGAPDITLTAGSHIELKANILVGPA